MDIIREIKSGESKTIEFKEDIPSNNSIAKSAISFSNTSGGKLFLGVDNQGEILGLTQDIDIISLEDRIAQLINDKCFPTINFDIYTVDIEGKNVLVLSVNRGNNTPYFLKSKGKENGTYVRIGATNRKANKEKIKELDLMGMNISFDQIINFEYDFNQLDLRNLKEAFNRVEKELTTTKLKNLELIKEHNGILRPTNGLLILLGKFEQCNVKCSKFKGTTMTEFLDRAEYTGDIFSQLDNSIRFIKKHINFGSKIDGLQRTDRYEIPLVAIREAVINALVHRDYQNYGRDIKIGIYDDILDIVSPGGFPMSITEENIFDGRSEIRNKVVARVFKELKYIERWGSGIKRIMDVCNKYDLKKPQFKESSDSVEVMLFRLEGANHEKNTEIEKLDLTYQENQIMEYLVNHKVIKRQNVEEILGVKETRANELIKNLIDKNLIKKIGKGPATSYEIL